MHVKFKPDTNIYSSFILLKILLLHVQEKKYLKIAEKVYFLAESQYFVCEKVHIKLQKCKAPDK